MCVQALNTLLVVDSRWPSCSSSSGGRPELTTLWVPMFMIIEVIFAAGIGLAISSTVIQMRDLVQVLPLVTTLGLFATPVIWPFSEDPHQLPRDRRESRVQDHRHTAITSPPHWVGGFTINLQMVYGFFNPLGPVINGARETMLLGHAPNWNLTGIAALGALLYLLIGYRDLQAPGGALCRHCLTGRSRSSTSGRSSAPTRRYRSSTTR